jgi:hypothetical protein
MSAPPSVQKLNQCAQNANLYKKDIEKLQQMNKDLQSQLEKTKGSYGKALQSLKEMQVAAKSTATSLSLSRRKKSRKSKKSKKSNKKRKSRRY